ncbi:MAG: low molecular weight protein arginine phosphatase [Candidatus Eiseniibacteriota bacterium]|nr:MAG: low molecular weight protein arginine phosphatase [Candidatus Eisenbacteria bacterium]
MAVGILEHLLPQELKGRVEATSAGVAAAAGEPASRNAVLVSKRQGIDISGHLSRRLAPELIEKADLTLVMQESHLAEVKRLSPERVEHALLLTEFGDCPGGSRCDIPDPVGRSEEVYEECFAQIESNLKRGIQFLAELVENKEASN